MKQLLATRPRFSPTLLAAQKQSRSARQPWRHCVLCVHLPLPACCRFFLQPGRCRRLVAPDSKLGALGSGAGSGVRFPLPGWPRAPGSGCRVGARSGSEVPNLGPEVLGIELRAPSSGTRTLGPELRVPGSGVWGPAYAFHVSGLRVLGSGNGPRALGPGFRVRAPGPGVRVRAPDSGRRVPDFELLLCALPMSGTRIVRRGPHFETYE